VNRHRAFQLSAGLDVNRHLKGTTHNAASGFLPGGAALTGLRVRNHRQAGSPDRRVKRRLRDFPSPENKNPYSVSAEQYAE